MKLSVSVCIRAGVSWLARSCGLLAAVVLGTLSLPAVAQVAGTGVVAGTVINAGTQKVLERAVVSVAGTDLSTFTLPDGRFRLSGVPAGDHNLVITYAGLEDTTIPVSVRAGETVTAEAALKREGPVLQLDTYTVSAEPEGNAYAVQQERTAETLRNVVSADAFGIISDANPGEFLKLIPGVDMDRTGIEPRGVRLRGMGPNLNLVMINGNQAAAAAGSATNRNFEFDQTTIDNIESIEVYKAPLPSMPANAIGGIVNMVTRSAFLQKGRRVSASVNMTMNSDALTLSKTAGPFDKPSRKVHPGGSSMYSDSLLDGRLGLVFSLSQVNVNGFGPNATRGIAYTGIPAAPAPYPADLPARASSYGRNEHSNYTERTGSSLNLDYKVSDATTVFLRTTFSDHYYFFANRTWNLGFGSAIAPGATPNRVEILSGGTATQAVTVGDKSSQALTFNPGAKHRFGDWTIEYDYSQSRATNRYDYLPDHDRVTGAPNFAAVNAAVTGLGFIVEHPDNGSAVARVTQTAGSDIYDLANYRITGTNISTNNRRSVDLVRGAKGRIRKDFVARFPFYVEVGGSIQKQTRSRHQPSKRWTYVGPDGVAGTADDTAGINLMQFAEIGHVPDIGFGQPAPNAWVSPFQLANFYSSNPQAFVLDEAHAYENDFRSNQTVSEKISAGYVMANVKFGKLSALVGARVEQTDIVAHGALQNNANVPAGVPVNSLEGMIAKYSRTTTTASYTPDPFKYVHLTYRHSDRLQARAAYTEAIGRPNFGEILPNTTVNETAQTITVSNTELLPQRSQSYDLSVEWYPSGTSSFTASWFSKDIKDYINRSSTPITAPIPGLDIGPEYVGYELITSSNLGSAKITGFEIGGRYQFAALRSAPEFLRGLDLFANFTHLYKLEGTFNSAEATTVYKKLADNAPYLVNYGFRYMTPNGKWFFELRGNYVGDKPVLINDRPERHTIERLTYDGEIRYKLSPRFTLSLAGRNITTETEGTQEFGLVTRTGNGGGAAYTLTLNMRH